MMTQVHHCPSCYGTAIVRHGTTPEGKHCQTTLYALVIGLYSNRSACGLLS